MAEKKKKEDSLWERVKKRAGEEIDMIKEKPSAFANIENAGKNVEYTKRKKSK